MHIHYYPLFISENRPPDSILSGMTPTCSFLLTCSIERLQLQLHLICFTTAHIYIIFHSCFSQRTQNPVLALNFVFSDPNPLLPLAFSIEQEQLQLHLV